MPWSMEAYISADRYFVRETAGFARMTIKGSAPRATATSATPVIIIGHGRPAASAPHLDRGARSARNLLNPASQRFVLIGHRKTHCFGGEIDGH